MGLNYIFAELITIFVAGLLGARKRWYLILGWVLLYGFLFWPWLQDYVFPLFTGEVYW